MSANNHKFYHASASEIEIFSQYVYKLDLETVTEPRVLHTT